MHRRWLDGLKWEDRREQVVFQEYLHHLDEIAGRLSRLNAVIHLEAIESKRDPWRMRDLYRKNIQAAHLENKVASQSEEMLICGAYWERQRGATDANRL